MDKLKEYAKRSVGRDYSKADDEIDNTYLKNIDPGLRSQFFENTLEKFRRRLMERYSHHISAEETENFVRKLF